MAAMTRYRKTRGGKRIEVELEGWDMSSSKAGVTLSHEGEVVATARWSVGNADVYIDIFALAKDGMLVEHGYSPNREGNAGLPAYYWPEEWLLPLANKALQAMLTHVRKAAKLDPNSGRMGQVLRGFAGEGYEAPEGITLVDEAHAIKTTTAKPKAAKAKTAKPTKAKAKGRVVAVGNKGKTTTKPKAKAVKVAKPKAATAKPTLEELQAQLANLTEGFHQVALMLNRK